MNDNYLGGIPKLGVCACVRDDALDCAQARCGDTDEPCYCVCHADAAGLYHDRPITSEKIVPGKSRRIPRK